jgi:hypothetical protein
VRVAEQEKEMFRELAGSVLGSGWVFRLAHMAGVAVRTAQRWASGSSTVPLPVLEDLRRQRELLAQTRTADRVWEIVRDAEAAGVSPHVVAALLKDIAITVRPDGDNKDSIPNS